MTSIIIERHLVITEERTSDNLSSILTPIPRGVYDNMARRVEVIGNAGERSLGQVIDQTTYYTFEGGNVLLPHGLIQVGRATTTDNMDPGFNMTRFFANSLSGLASLYQECGLNYSLIQ